MQIAKHTVATIDYTLTGAKGDLLDSSKGRMPLTYLHGGGSILPGIERALEGKSSGDTVKVTLAPEDAYGQKDPKMVHPVPRESFSGMDDIKVGTQFRAQTPAGPRIVTVVEVAADTVTVDANHPLAGETITIEATVVGIRQATPDEIEHGHACAGQCGNAECCPG